MPFRNQTPEPKKILCIHDLSCFGRCSIAVIAPVLSTMGHQAIALPTVTLSTHTGGLGAPAACTQDGFGTAALAHYKALGIQFDCIYTGYLGGSAGIALAKAAFAQYPDAFKVVDPVMGDHGKPYTGITADYIAEMRTLCSCADLILPNYTEAHLLQNLPHPETPCTAEIATETANALTALAPTVLMTGVPISDTVACAAAGRESFVVKNLRLPRTFPGTGDLFGAATIGALLRGNALSAAAENAAAFVCASIQNTAEDADTRYGVWFEPLLSRLI